MLEKQGAKDLVDREASQFPSTKPLNNLNFNMVCGFEVGIA